MTYNRVCEAYAKILDRLGLEYIKGVWNRCMFESCRIMWVIVFLIYVHTTLNIH